MGGGELGELQKTEMSGGKDIWWVTRLGWRTVATCEQSYVLAKDFVLIEGCTRNMILSDLYSSKITLVVI